MWLQTIKLFQSDEHVASCVRIIVRTGTLLGMLYKDGLLDRLDHPMLDFFDDRHIANVDDSQKAAPV